MRLDTFHLPTALLLLAALPTETAAKRPPSPKAVLLSDIQSLTFRGGNAKTTHRRLPAIPQLKCVSSPSLCALHAIDIMRCENRGAGYDPDDVQWSCSASLPPELRLGSTDVLCEGYSSPDDPYVLRGSCGVQYTLALTDLGERRHPHLTSGGGWGDWFSRGGKNNDNYYDDDAGTEWSAYLFSLIFFAVLAWILYSACAAGYRNRTLGLGGNRRGWGGGGGGGGGGGWGGGGGPGWQPWNDPPPPYPGTKNTQSEGWRPGFWTGAASGAAAAYLAGSRNNNNDRYGGRFADRYDDDRYESRRTGWGSGFGGGGGASSSRASGPSRTSSSASSTTRHESTGFGSTQRR
ncbi:hypothetical protein ACRALDRAFT_1072657 [Sodiomyces alcalophilus JCM 7366]|uniref:uncharacterized protein n=1 Tax=Sodiomyces alcalophilus JCM 7366 TaxID=591952 RepID=UPI0039B678F1